MIHLESRLQISQLWFKFHFPVTPWLSQSFLMVFFFPCFWKARIQNYLCQCNFSNKSTGRQNLATNVWHRSPNRARWIGQSVLAGHKGNSSPGKLPICIIWQRHCRAFSLAIFMSWSLRHWKGGMAIPLLFSKPAPFIRRNLRLYPTCSFNFISTATYALPAYLSLLINVPSYLTLISFAFDGHTRTQTFPESGKDLVMLPLYTS